MKTFRTGAHALMAAIAIANGCNSFQTVPLEDIEAKPRKFINKKVRVHYVASLPDTFQQGEGRSVRARDIAPASGVSDPDSTVRLKVLQMDYPFVSGRTFSEAKMFGAVPPADTVRVNLAESSKIEVHDFHAGYTALCLFGMYVLVWFVAGATGADWATPY